MRLLKVVCGLIAAVIGTSNHAYAADISELSLEELSDLKVYTASKKAEDPLRSPSAIYVISADDIQQMGALTIPDALRTVPGLHVAKMASNKWSVSSRGFGGQYVTNLLVLLDGRPVYSTLFSGVFWDQVDIPMNDIKQIEVVRGPGASVWGLNAVNGVINIITKSSEDTVGKYASITIGDYTNNITEARYGAKIDDKSSYRAYLKYRNFDSYEALNYAPYNDAWSNGTAGFRYDSSLSYRDSIELSGQIRKSNAHQSQLLPSLSAPYFNLENAEESYKSAYLLGKWQHGISERSDLLVTSYVEANDIDLGYIQVQNEVFEIEAKNDFSINKAHDLTWGAGTRLVTDRFENSEYLIYNPSHRVTNFTSIFAQDKIALLPNELYLTLGTKFEYNSYSGLEFLPSFKIAWTFSPNQTAWASISKAVRNPSRGSADLTLNAQATPFGYVSLIGHSSAQPEELTAYEIGYKNSVRADLDFNVSAYYNHYEDLRTFESIRGPFDNIILPLDIAANGSADTMGLELDAKYTPSRTWWISAGYGFMYPRYHLNADSNDTLFNADEKKSPKHSGHIRSQIHLNDVLTTNHSLYALSELSSIDVPTQFKYDANLVWQINEQIKLGAYGNNLLDRQHQEFAAPLYGYETEIPRSYYLQLTIQM